MGKFIDLTGQRVGAWTVIKRTNNDKNKNTKYLCRCECGKEKEVLGYSLNKGKSLSCGCLRTKKANNIIGKRFGRLIVLKRVQDKYLCKCDCGNSKLICKSSLIHNLTNSCGCLAKEKTSERTLKHGLNRTRIYNIYNKIKSRCYYLKDISYKNYGGRGIIICDEWLNAESGFVNFYNWAMRNGYKDDLSIDRKDVNGNYEPNNCRWVTRTTQNNNKRNNIMIEYNGQIHTLKEWSRILGLNYKRLFKRYIDGYCVEDIFYNGDLRKRRGNEKIN